MNGIIGCASLLKITELDEDQQEYFDTIQKSGKSLLVIINDILDYSKIEAGKIDLEQESFDLRECLEDAFALLEQNASKKGIEIAYSISATTPRYLIGDATRIRQVLVNLVGNALKFTHKGEVVGRVKRMGFQHMDTVSDGDEAVVAANECPCDIILMDVSMPRMNGLDATREIRINNKAKSAPWILGHSAAAMDGDEELAIESGMDGYLTKPIKLEELKAALAHFK